MQSTQARFLSRFRRFITDNDLFTENDRILLALSGGVDSTVLAHLLYNCGFKFAIAHCNYRLRGADSEGDEAFAQDLAEMLGVSFYSTKFDTLKEAESRKLSIQMAARELRYAWFDELLTTHGYSYIATAHHKNDLAETVLLNLVKGSVMRGLHGILAKHDDLVRPMLWAEKAEIESYAALQDISCREDKSNAENKYQRNIIRNQVMPLLNKINPDLTDTVYKTSHRRLQIETWMERQSELLRNSIIKASLQGMTFPLEDILKHEVPAEIFFQWIAPHGFNYVQVEELFADLASTESRRFFSPDEELVMVKDRQSISIRENLKIKSSGVLVYQDDTTVMIGSTVFETETMKPADIKDYKDQTIAFLDMDKLEFPLLIRHWQEGDFFYPFGMRGSKKISDYITDLKLDTAAKASLLVICSGSRICAVAGRRIDDRYKVSPNTKAVFKLKMMEEKILQFRNA